MEQFDQILVQAIERRREAQLYRDRAVIDGRQYVNFSSNDYLGLSHHPAVIDAAIRATRQFGAGSGASALITGYTPVHASVEKALARWKRTEAAVLLPSGYQANHAAVQSIVGACDSVGRDVRFLFDKLVHASLIDAVVGSRKPFRTFGHNDLVKLEHLLSEAPADETQVVVTESIFSMDGDA